MLVCSKRGDEAACGRVSWFVDHVEGKLGACQAVVGAVVEELLSATAVLLVPAFVAEVEAALVRYCTVRLNCGAILRLSIVSERVWGRSRGRRTM